MITQQLPKNLVINSIPILTRTLCAQESGPPPLTKGSHDLTPDEGGVSPKRGRQGRLITAAGEQNECF